MSEPMLLWLPASGYECDEEFLHHASSITAANDAILNFCDTARSDSHLSMSDLLDTIEYYGADVDHYRFVLDANLRARGF